MRKETWKRSVEFPEYEVSDCGRVRKDDYSQSYYNKFGALVERHYKGGLCVQHNSGGYRTVNLSKNVGERRRKKVTRFVHRLVLETFVGHASQSNPQANHINHDKTDNRLENLEWVSNSVNQKHSLLSEKRKGLTAKDVRELRSRTHKFGDYVEWAKEFGVHWLSIRAAYLGETWCELEDYEKMYEKGKLL